MKQLVYSAKSLGAALRRARKAKQLNQREAGLPFKVEQSTVSDIERGTPGTRLDTLFRLLAALDLEIIVRSKSQHDTKDRGW